MTRSTHRSCGAARAALTALALGATACLGGADPGATSPDHLHSDRGGIGVTQQALAPIALDLRRSLAVTDQVITQTFSLTAVLQQLADQAGAGQTGVGLFTQLWDTQNTRAAGVTSGPHCDDNGGAVNGFPYDCRPVEGALALSPTAAIATFSLVGLFNRFDLAPASGADCGEYRMVFARTSGGGRAFIIFEAVVANPQPALGLDGCRPIAAFWADLSANPSAAARATALHDFYFQGLPGFQPVIHLDNYGATGLTRATGQVRLNEFIGAPWMLRELKLQRPLGPALTFVPVSVKTNPFGKLFAPPTSAQATAFQTTVFPGQVAALAVNDLNAFTYAVPDSVNAAQANSQNFGGTDDYAAQFAANATFAAAIQTQLNAIGSALTPAQLVARAEALSCAGCHQLANGANLGGGLTWPSSAGFVHATELTEPGPDGNRFMLSTALTSVFLPHRAQVLQAFLGRAPEAADYDGDRKADVIVYRPTTYTFHLSGSANGFATVTSRTLGQLGDVPLGSSDFDGDGKADFTVFRPSDHTWNTLTAASGFNTLLVRTWGIAGDVPMPAADYDGDGKADLAVFRPSDGTWNILRSSTGFTTSTSTKWGVGQDQPLAGADYDGDGKADLAVWRKTTRTFNIQQSSTGALLQRAQGAVGDLAVSGADYDGDGKADLATWNPTTFGWIVRTSSSGWQAQLAVTWGAAGDVPLAGADFDGDGKADFVVYRPSAGTWNVLTSASGYTASTSRRFGNATDRPLGR